MTYIKWKDEVESYLVNLPQEEKQKIFSYFSEMYADKRDAGKSEEQIIEEFGAPYDVAQRILADSRESADAPDGDAKVSGGNNYNYNYYNYNYGGAQQGGRQAPQTPPPPPPSAAQAPQPQPQPQNKKSVARVIFGIIFTIALIGLTIALIGGAVTLVVEGFISIGFTAGALAASQCGGADGAAMIGWGLVVSGLGCILLAPFSALCSFLWRKLRAFIKGV